MILLSERVIQCEKIAYAPLTLFKFLLLLHDDGAGSLLLCHVCYHCYLITGVFINRSSKADKSSEAEKVAVLEWGVASDD